MSKPAPLCRYCGKPIAKHTETHYVRLQREGGGATSPGPNDHRVDNRPRSKADCQRLTDHTVISVKYHEEREYMTGELKSRHVWSFNTWDGKTYQDEHFCNGEHARHFGYLMAQNGYCTAAYNEAMGKAA